MKGAKYPLKELLQVREYKEELAQQDLALAGKKEEEAKEAWHKKQQDLQEYRAWRLVEEKERYQAIMGTRCTKRSLDELKNEMEQLKVRELAFEQESEEAHSAWQECGKALKEAREAFSKVQKDKEKLLLHKDLWKKQALQEEMKREEQELDEFTRMKKT